MEIKITVATTTLDAEIAAGAPLPDLIKMDIEFAEHLALKWARQLLDRGRTIIAFECYKREAIDLLLVRNWAVFAVDQLNNCLAVPPPMIESARPVTRNLTKVE